jgi:hypothetical protein
MLIYRQSIRGHTALDKIQGKTVDCVISVDYL